MKPLVGLTSGLLELLVLFDKKSDVGCTPRTTDLAEELGISTMGVYWRFTQLRKMHLMRKHIRSRRGAQFAITRKGYNQLKKIKKI